MIGICGHQAAEIAAGKGHEVERPRDADRWRGLGQGGRRALDPRQLQPGRRPFVTVSSAAIQPDHMEEVLFGRETPERGVEQGLLEQAHGGIIYFDEVADMPLGTQSKILRVLVDQSFTRVGGTAKVRVDLRVISSTTRDLTEEIAAAGSARNCITGSTWCRSRCRRWRTGARTSPNLPPFHRAVQHRTGPALRELGEDAVAMLQTMSWPGNVRQFRNVIERVLILGDGTGPIEAATCPAIRDGQSGGGRHCRCRPRSRPCRCARRGSCSNATTSWRRSTGSAAISAARRASWAWNARRCTAS
jgi:DNA-binding NtrC family response regulator